MSQLSTTCHSYSRRGVCLSAYVLNFFLLLSLLPSIESVIGQETKGTIRGRILDRATNEGLIGVNITVIGKYLGTFTNRSGFFVISNIPFGKYTIKISHLGYEDKMIADVLVSADTVELNIALIEKPILLKEITVTPGQVSIMQGQATALQALDRKDIEALPQFGADIYRGAARLPGVMTNDYSAKFTVRGGEYEEILVLLDGMELYEPFHLKDIEGGAGSIIDVSTIEGIDLMAGGYTAEYGNCMSGVFKMYSRQSPQSRRYSAGLSLLNARVMSEGKTKDGKGSWLFSARRGYLDFVLPLIGEDESLKPTFYDTYGKFQYQLHRNHIISFNTLYAHDIFKLVEDDDDESRTRYSNFYFWAALVSQWSDRLSSQTLSSFTRMNQQRNGLGYFEEPSELEYNITDKRKSYTLGLKQDWTLDMSDQWLVKWGWDLRKLYSTYNYFYARRIYFITNNNNLASRIDTNVVKIDPNGYTLGIYAANRFRLADPLVMEIGLRYDRSSYTRDHVVSPRGNIVYKISHRTTVKGGWGYNYQMQGIQQINVQDKENKFYKAQKSEHYVVGLEHMLPSNIQFRVDGYYKKLSHLRPSYRNLTNALEIFPELQRDRALIYRERGVSKGLELYLKHDDGGRFTWWASYALSKVTDHVTTMFSRGSVSLLNKDVPSLRDQLHTINLDMNYRPNARWQFNIAWQYHTGWHYTEYYFRKGTSNQGVYYYDETGSLYGKKYPAFHKLDFRISRIYRTQNRGIINVYFEVFNAYNHSNVRSYNYDGRESGNNVYYQKSAETWLPILPSIGISWTFEQ
ncbi:TonB-dependent receptor [bacterium]|nr:TonB-dependent receptor [bacterium]